MAHFPLPAFVVLAALLAAPGFARAHAILVESSPAANANAPQGHVDIQLRYNSRVDRLRSRLTLSRPGETPEVLAIGPGGSEDILTTAADLAPGLYTLHWQVLALDGHITRGAVAFTVSAPESTPAKPPQT
jgi:copper resistance protein C